MGGAIAICGALGIIIDPHHKLHSVVTFGAPRVVIPKDMDEEIRLDLETRATTIPAQPRCCARLYEMDKL